MFPIRDDNPTELFPFVTLLLMAGCVGAWFLFQGAGFSEQTLMNSVCTFGMIPSELTGTSASGGPCNEGGLTWVTGATSMCMHGSWMHLIGNMWFLWIFGNNIEDSMGQGWFLVFYLLCGLIATGAHVISTPDSPIPTVGASGAISGIMGAYLMLYPKVRISTLLVLVIFIQVIRVPAWFMLGYWLVLQVATSMVQGPTGGGVAVWAHIGGFVAGAFLVFAFKDRTLVEAKGRGEQIPRSQLRYGGWI